MAMVYLYASPLTDYQLCPHGEVIARLVLFGQVEVGMAASLDPHMEACVVAPALAHDLPGRQVLLGLALVDVEHEEEDFLGHFGNDGQVDHLIGGTDGAAVRVLLGLLGRQVVVDFGQVRKGSVEHVIRDFQGLLREENDLFIHLL